MPSVDIDLPNRIANAASPLELADANGASYRLTPNTSGQIAITKDGSAVSLPVLRPTVAKTASYTCVVGDCGTLFTTTGGSGALTFTLPAVAGNAGLWFEFVNTVGQNLLITAPAGTLVSFNNAAGTTATFSTAGNLIGAGGVVYCDGAKWILRPSGANTMVIS